MTDGLRIAHPQDCPLEGNPEVGNPEGNHCKWRHLVTKFGTNASGAI